MNRRTLGLLAALVLVWGANWPILKLALAYIGPLWLAVARLGLGAACLFVLLAVSGRSLRPPARRDWLIVLNVGLLQMAAFSALTNLGLEVVPAGRSAILVYTTPLWVVPGAVLLLGERLGPAKLAGLALGFAGVAVLFNPLGFAWTGPAVLGNGLLLAAALAWAVSILHVRGHRWRREAIELAPWQMLLAMLVLIPPALAIDGPPRADWGWELAAVMLYNGPLATAFGFMAAVTVTRRLPATTSSLAFLGVPAAGLLFSTWALGEPLGLDLLLGLALICAGVAAVTLAGRRRRPPGSAAAAQEGALEGEAEAIGRLGR